METDVEIMRTLNTFGVQFSIRQDKLKNGKAPVYVRITVNGDIVHLALKQWVDPKFWNTRRGTGKGIRDEILTVNNNLEQTGMALGNHYQQMPVKGLYITAAAIKEAYLGNADEEPNTLTR